MWDHLKYQTEYSVFAGGSKVGECDDLTIHRDAANWWCNCTSGAANWSNPRHKAYAAR
ncbi:hypothetical protein OIHEL45_07155 [Sulfitobacter indolifex HEL-45]|uniref:Uncharacterized protein n=1 Tax=Sulfitobacter indolifex HEL-45 TaxID=391624 RepID=A0ABM9XAP4_9RHOB|nr:hypothetical protein OIHEL45_07155 [Sulfitobacter indolifex HEL-45]